MAPPCRGRERVGFRSRRGDRSGQGQRPEKALSWCRMHEQDGYQRQKCRHNPAHHVDDHQRHRRPFGVADAIDSVLWAASCVLLRAVIASPCLQGAAPSTARRVAVPQKCARQDSEPIARGASASCPHASHDRQHASLWRMRRSSARAPPHDAARPECSARSRARTPRLLLPAAGADRCPSVLTDGREPRHGLQPLTASGTLYVSLLAKRRHKNTRECGRALRRAPRA